MKLEKIAPPAREGDVRVIEERLGTRLSEDYRAFLVEHNEGIP